MESLDESPDELCALMTKLICRWWDSKPHANGSLDRRLCRLGYHGEQSQCSEQDSNLQQRESRSRASAGIGLPEHPGRTRRSAPTKLQWTPEGVEPSFPGGKPGVFPLDDGPKFSCCGKDSNLQPRPSEGRALFRLSYRNVVIGPLSFVLRHLPQPRTKDQ